MEANDTYDNCTGGPTFTELLWSRLEAELLAGGCFLNVEDVSTKVFERSVAAAREYLSLDYKSLEQVETEYHSKHASRVDCQTRLLYTTCMGSLYLICTKLPMWVFSSEVRHPTFDCACRQ